MSAASYYDVCGSSSVREELCSSDLPMPALSETAIFLDFDGTLVDIADTPEGIEVPSDLPELLRDLGHVTNGAMAIVTGRRHSDIETFLPAYDGPLASAHGARVVLNDEVHDHSVSGSDLVDTICRMCNDFAETIPGLLAEAKPTGVVLHFRGAPEAEADALKFVRMLSEVYDGFEMHVSKMAYELRPNDIGKDKAVAWFLERPPFAGRKPIFFGDDTTDEAALSLVREMGGLSVRVGDGDTSAEYRIPDPKSARAVLKEWLRQIRT